MSIPIGLLEIHASHACNLTCESCSHFSSNGHTGMPDLAEADAWMKNWNQRLVPDLFRIVGGEPTLNPHLPEFVEIAARNWPHSRIALTTNGFFLHRHPRLPEVLSRHNVILRWTIHHQSEEYLARTREISRLIDIWRQQHSFELVIEEAYARWTRRHRGFAAAVMPFQDHEPRKSWENCPCKNCMQLFRGRLWKCSPIAYLRLQKETYPNISHAWDDYLDYQGLGPDSGDEDLRAFLERTDESICGMCSADPERFDKPSPLIPLGILRRAARMQVA